MTTITSLGVVVRLLLKGVSILLTGAFILELILSKFYNILISILIILSILFI